jgi:acyl carrier protein
VLGWPISSGATIAPPQDQPEEEEMPSETFDIVADTISKECSVPRGQITPESHVVDDLGLDSIAFLDVCYELDTRLGVKIPYEQWVTDINTGKVDAKQLFIMQNLVAAVDKLVADRATVQHT